MSAADLVGQTRSERSIRTMALTAGEPTDMAEVLAAEPALRRLEAYAIGVGSGFVFEKAFMCVIEVRKVCKDLLVGWARR